MSNRAQVNSCRRRPSYRRPVNALGSRGKGGVAVSWKSLEEAPAEAWYLEYTDDVGPRQRALVHPDDIASVLRGYGRLGVIRRATMMQRFGRRYYDHGSISLTFDPALEPGLLG